MEDQFSVLVSKILSGEATPEENIEFRKLLADDTEQQQIYSELKEYWEADVKYSIINNREITTDKIMNRINASESKSNIRRSILKISTAAVIFLITSFALIYIFKENGLILNNTYTYAAQTLPVEYTLSDGSKVTLNKNSSITIGSNFGSKYRNVKLEGEAYFVVAKDKSRPFVVETYNTKTKVLGTIFNIKSTATEVLTTLVEGSVLFSSVNCNETLKPNQELKYDITTSSFKTEECDIQLNTSWVSGRYNYSGLTFLSYINKLESIYNRKIQIHNDKLSNQTVSASFLVGEPLEDILDALKVEMGFEYAVDRNGSIKIETK